MPKRPIGLSVLEAAKKRIRIALDHTERAYVSFSGGKDSTVMLHLVMEEAIKRDREIGVLFIDLEGQYKMTIDHIRLLYKKYEHHIKPFWVALPIHLRNAVSVYEPFWICWNPSKKKSWVRPMPKEAIKELSYFPFFCEGMEFEEFVPEFGEWYSQDKPTACFVGNRADESLNRYRSIAREDKGTINGELWSTAVTPHVFNVYPIYDWKTQDLWTYHGINTDKPYNRLYDFMHKAGLTIHQMRICQPYGDDQRRGLWLFHLIEPETWARVVARVNGANGGALYVNQSGNITGYRKISKPEGHTWESFAHLLVNSMPPKTKEHYQNKIALFEKWYTERGYPDGMPDEADYVMEQERSVPSWRRVCKSLLRNDWWCKGLGFSQQRSSGYAKYLDLMKRRQRQWQVDGFSYGLFDNNTLTP